jgi:hypothetical protein
MLLEKPGHKNLQVPDSLVVISMIGAFPWGIAEACPSWGVYVQHVCCLGPAVGVGVELNVLQGRLTAGRLGIWEAWRKGTSTGHNKLKKMRTVSSDIAVGFLGALCQGRTSWA